MAFGPYMNGASTRFLQLYAQVRSGAAPASHSGHRGLHNGNGKLTERAGVRCSSGRNSGRLFNDERMGAHAAALARAFRR